MINKLVDNILYKLSSIELNDFVFSAKFSILV